MAAAAAEVSFDAIEQILLRSDVEDLVRCKNVCKSWYSLISSPPFVKAHLKYSYDKDRNDPELGHRRIDVGIYADQTFCLMSNEIFVVGSCNGLVCVSPKDVKFVVTNPCTREYKKIQTPPFLPPTREPVMLRKLVCWGFGYDSSADDYKVIVGFREDSVENMGTLFYSLTLKSNVWKFIGELEYSCLDNITGIFYGGALLWFMSDANKKVIVSLDLSTEEFKEVPQPTNIREYQGHQINRRPKLGIVDNCLCIFTFKFTYIHIWVMRNNKWEPYNDECKSKKDLVHRVVESQTSGFSHDDGGLYRSDHSLMSDSIFVKSLVSPHPCVNNDDNYYLPMNSNKSVQSGVKGIKEEEECEEEEVLVSIKSLSHKFNCSSLE